MADLVKLFGDQMAKNPRLWIGNALSGLAGYDPQKYKAEDTARKVAAERARLLQGYQSAKGDIFATQGLDQAGNAPLTQGQEVSAEESMPNALQKLLASDVRAGEGLLKFGGPKAVPEIIKMLSPHLRRQRMHQQSDKAGGSGKLSFGEYQELTPEIKDDYDRWQRFKGATKTAAEKNIATMNKAAREGDNSTLEAMLAQVYDSSGKVIERPGGGKDYMRVDQHGNHYLTPVMTDEAAQKGLGDKAATEEIAKLQARDMTNARNELGSTVIAYNDITRSLNDLLNHPDSRGHSVGTFAELAS